MTDELSERYGQLLAGSYDCVDRIVLNAYNTLCYSPGGFRHWWRQLMDGSDAELDNAHLMRMAGRFGSERRRCAGRPPTQSSRGGRAIVQQPVSQIRPRARPPSPACRP